MATMDVGGGSFEQEVSRPGVVLVHWWAADSLAAEFSAAAFEAASRRNPNARFFTVNVDKERALAREYQVGAVPTLMVFRDGTLVFAGAGPFTFEQAEQLLTAVEALDMDEVRRSRNGHGKGTPAFAVPSIWTATGASPD